MNEAMIMAAGQALIGSSSGSPSSLNMRPKTGTLETMEDAKDMVNSSLSDQVLASVTVISSLIS
jgi:hypothetical protein